MGSLPGCGDGPHDLHDDERILTSDTSPGSSAPVDDVEVTFEVTFVDDHDEVAAALAAVDAEVVGVDVERADAHHYFRRAALIQLGIPGHCVLLDAVAIDAFPEVDAFFGPERLMVLHALQNDLEPLAGRAIEPDRVADTAIAATVLGLPTGLGTLLDELLGVQLDGDKGAFQRADWELRPLDPDMAAYAAGDVVHLPRLWEELRGRLDEAGRTDWYVQELEATIELTGEDSRAWTRVKGSGRLSEQERAVLRCLWEAREQIARTHDIAPNRLLHDDVLRELATDPPRTAAQLVRRSQRRRSQLRQHAQALLEAIERGLSAEPEIPSDDSRRWTEQEQALHDALRKARAEVAKDVGLDAGVLCPSRPLWSAIAARPSDGEQLCRAAGLRPWQTELLAGPLWEAYEANAPDTTDG
jgi:ribonuclease D